MQLEDLSNSGSGSLQTFAGRLRNVAILRSSEQENKLLPVGFHHSSKYWNHEVESRHIHGRSTDVSIWIK